jgi:hypothetical protein
VGRLSRSSLGLALVDCSNGYICAFSRLSVSNQWDTADRWQAVRFQAARHWMFFWQRPVSLCSDLVEFTVNGLAVMLNRFQLRRYWRLLVEPSTVICPRLTALAAA